MFSKIWAKKSMSDLRYIYDDIGNVLNQLLYSAESEVLYGA